MDPVLKEDRREMKKLKAYMDRRGFVADAQNGILKRCPCGERIIADVSPDPKYAGDFDTFPGRRYFTCKGFEGEFEILTKRVEEMAVDIAKLKEAMTVLQNKVIQQ